MQSANILFIDDDSLFTDVIGHKLTEAGYTCFYAPSGAVAFEMLSKDQPDLILLDVTMPDMNGFEVLEKLKADARTSAIPVLMFSNDATEENKKRSHDMGAVSFMEKVQVSPGEVVSTVAAALGR